MKNSGGLWSFVSQNVQEGATTETILERLRSDGASKIESIRALCDGAGMSLADAKRAVHFSSAWADVKERDERIWDELEAALGKDMSKFPPAGS
jgi:ribosomal protein L7/L12